MAEYLNFPDASMLACEYFLKYKICAFRRQSVPPKLSYKSNYSYSSFTAELLQSQHHYHHLDSLVILQ